MSQENLEVVRMMAEAFNQGGWERAIDDGLLHPRIEYHDDRRWPEARSTVGTSALVERFAEVLEVLGKNAHVEVEELLDCEDDWVLMTFRFSGQARASGIRHEYRWSFLCRVCDGQIDYMQAYLDPEEALEAAGLSQ
jgi:ketosteroid isomerase-like protein